VDTGGHASKSRRERLSIEAGQATVAMTVLPFMVKGLGITHGGAIFTLADSVFTLACNAYNERTISSHCSISLVRATRLGVRRRKSYVPADPTSMTSGLLWKTPSSLSFAPIRALLPAPFSRKTERFVNGAFDEEPCLLGRAMMRADAEIVSVRLAGWPERPLIERLSQFYIYDFSEMEPPTPENLEFDDQGSYAPFRGLDSY
jgi:hypothetical protein